MRIAHPLIRDSVMPPQARRWVSGIASLDTALGGGMAYGRIHEIYAAEPTDAPAAMGWAAALATGMGTAEGGTAEGGVPEGGMPEGATPNPAGTQGPIVWLRSQRSLAAGGVLQANGWAELGGIPGNVLLSVACDAMTLLRTAADALRCAVVGAVIMESWGRMRELDLTASRRLALAAEKSGVPLFLLRIDAQPAPSAAQTRWQVASAPSRALPGHAPGLPTFDIELLRQRSGPCGLSWRLEWDRDQRKFREPPVSGAVVSVPVRRSAADTGSGLPHPDSRYAA